MRWLNRPGSGDGLGLPRGGYRVDKAFVDLDDVDPQLLDVRKTVAASPEVVQSDPYTEALQGNNNAVRGSLSSSSERSVNSSTI